MMKFGYSDVPLVTTMRGLIGTAGELFVMNVLSERRGEVRYETKHARGVFARLVGMHM